MMRWWICIALAACANNVPYDRATGPDGKLSGAKPLALEGEGPATGKAKDIITYPGGDRIDWKLIELPAEKEGTLSLKLSWRTPRPGLQLDFDVFDEGHRPVNIKSTKLKRVRELTIDKARGKYFVRIFAPKRGDAATYELDATFAAFAPKQAGVIWHEYPVPLPPKVAEVPQQEPNTPTKAGPCPIYDPSNPTCDKVCAPSSPPNHPPCLVQPPPPPCKVHDPLNPNCAKVCASGAPPTHAPCRKPLLARMLDAKVVGTETHIIISIGSKDGVDKSWRPRILRGQSSDPLPEQVTIDTVDRERTTLRVKMTVDRARENQRIELLPPLP